MRATGTWGYFLILSHFADSYPITTSKPWTVGTVNQSTFQEVHQNHDQLGNPWDHHVSHYSPPDWAGGFSWWLHFFSAHGPMWKGAEMGMFITKYLEKYIQLFFNPIRIKVSFESAFLQFSEERYGSPPLSTSYMPRPPVMPEPADTTECYIMFFPIHKCGILPL